MRKLVEFLHFETYYNIARYNLINTKYYAMAFQSLSDGALISPNHGWLTSHLLEPLVKQTCVVTARGRQPMKFVV